MPRGELAEYLEQLPTIVEILSGGAVKLEVPDDDEDR